MAKAITHIEKQIPNQIEEQSEAIAAVLAAIAEHHESLLMTLDILGELQKTGALDILRALLNRRHEVGAIAIGQLNQSGMHRMIKNGMTVIQFLSQLDPAQMQNLLNALAGGVQRAAETGEDGKQIGLWAMGKSFVEPEVKASLSTMLNFLRGMGSELNQEQPNVH